MNSRQNKLFLAFAASLSCATFATVARADGSERLERWETHGFGDSIGRVTAAFADVKGSYPGGGPSYSRTGVVADLDFIGFWDATRFGTLIGAEWNTRVGLLTAESYDGGIAPANQTATDSGQPRGNSLVFRTEAAFDYGIIGFGDQDDVHGRILFGAGAGMDYDGGSGVYTHNFADSGFRGYLLLLARAHLWLSDDLALHFAAHYLPLITGTWTQTEYRVEAAVAISKLQLGARWILDTAHEDGTSDSVTSNQLNAFIGYDF
ncbi:MAG: hypothetical protein ACHREM_23565 [Polyangiales bacterium]